MACPIMDLGIVCSCLLWQCEVCLLFQNDNVGGTYSIPALIAKVDVDIKWVVLSFLINMSLIPVVPDTTFKASSMHGKKCKVNTEREHFISMACI